jgi:hypothetical protein
MSIATGPPASCHPGTRFRSHHARGLRTTRGASLDSLALCVGKPGDFANRSPS